MLLKGLLTSVVVRAADGNGIVNYTVDLHFDAMDRIQLLQEVHQHWSGSICCNRHRHIIPEGQSEVAAVSNAAKRLNFVDTDSVRIISGGTAEFFTVDPYIPRCSQRERTSVENSVFQCIQLRIDIKGTYTTVDDQRRVLGIAVARVVLVIY